MLNRSLTKLGPHALVVGLAMVLGACADAEPSDGMTAASDGSGGGDASTGAKPGVEFPGTCEAEDVPSGMGCPAGWAPMFRGGDDPPTVIDAGDYIKEYPNGYYLPEVETEADELVALLLEPNDQCVLVCWSACHGSLCVAGSAQPGGEAKGFFCGEATLEDCQEFLDALE